MFREKLLTVTKKVILTAPTKALTSSGFVKATIYSFISFACVWGVTLLKEDATVSQLGQYAVLIPLINSILVLAKEYIDELRN